jgi:hypothetical protein
MTTKTTKPQHTPGPWSYGGHGYAGREVVGPNGLTAICVMSKADSTAGHRDINANARLIAAAPELLEALRDLARVAIINSGKGQDMEGYAAFDRARAVIAKATGED